MELNDTWDNVVFKGTDYLKIRRALAGGVAVFFPEDSLTVEEDGITMTSILFCRHGGIIYPETSGQSISYNYSFEDIIDEKTAEQDELYSKGRNGNGDSVVTNAKGGSSYHNYGLAIDIARIVGNKVSYDFEWDKVEAIGAEYGFEWGGNWTSFKDMPHFQITFGYTTSELFNLYKAGKMEDGYVVLEQD